MKSFETIRTWLVIGGLLLFSGLASLAWVALSGQEGISGPNVGLDLGLDFTVDPGEPVTIQLDQYLLGEVLVEAPLLRELHGREVPPLLLTAVLTAITIGGLLAVGVPLAFIYVMLDRQAKQIKEDPEVQEKQAALAKKEAERLRKINALRPPRSAPSHAMRRWAVASTALTILFFVIPFSFALADTFFAEGEIALGNNIFVDPGLIVSAVLGTITVIALAATLGRLEIIEADDADRGRIPWGALWVALTGFIFLGIGMGLMLALRSAGG